MINKTDKTDKTEMLCDAQGETCAEREPVDICDLEGEALLRELCLEFGPSGYERQVRQMIEKRARRDADSTLTDRMGNLICKMSFGDPDAKRERIMLSAHMDEVGFMIDSITSEGMLTYGCVGGIDPSVMAGRKVIVRGDDRFYSGVVCSKAIHHKSAKEREQPIPAKKLCIDVGCTTKEEAQEHFSIGNMACFDSEFYSFGKDGINVKGKAIDDRMGCAALLEIMTSLKSEPISHNLDIYFCFTVREEIGYTGALCAANAIAPTLAVVLETTAISDLPETPAHLRVAEVGGGVTVSLADRATLYDRELCDRVFALAKEKSIEAQPKRYVSGGNDAGKIHKALSGIKTLAISVPTRYLHSPACVANMKDYSAQKRLVEAVIRHMDQII